MKRLVIYLNSLYHFRKMSEECRLGWPMVRERVVAMSDKVRNSLVPLFRVQLEIHDGGRIKA